MKNEKAVQVLKEMLAGGGNQRALDDVAADEKEKVDAVVMSIVGICKDAYQGKNQRMLDAAAESIFDESVENVGFEELTVDDKVYLVVGRLLVRLYLDCVERRL